MLARDAQQRGAATSQKYTRDFIITRTIKFEKEDVSHQYSVNQYIHIMCGARIQGGPLWDAGRTLKCIRSVPSFDIPSYPNVKSLATHGT